MATNRTAPQTRERRKTATAALHRMRDTFEEEDLLTQQFHDTIREKANVVSSKFMVSDYTVAIANRYVMHVTGRMLCYVFIWRFAIAYGICPLLGSLANQRVEKNGINNNHGIPFSLCAFICNFRLRCFRAVERLNHQANHTSVVVHIQTKMKKTLTSSTRIRTSQHNHRHHHHHHKRHESVHEM